MQQVQAEAPQLILSPGKANRSTCFTATMLLIRGQNPTRGAVLLLKWVSMKTAAGDDFLPSFSTIII